MKVEFEGRIWDLDTQGYSFAHAVKIQKFTGMSIGDWSDSLEFKKDEAGKILNPPPEWLVSVGALYWLMLAQNGEDVPLGEDMHFDFQGFLGAYFTALGAELDRLKAQAEPDPTVPPPTIPGPPGDPGSTAPATPTATTPQPVPEGAAIAS